MAPPQSHAVKSLNKSSGRRRFVFKSVAQRIEEIEVKVFRNPDVRIKPEPSKGDSFFLECLVEWRELNTAEHFISFYEEMLPNVQTLHLVLWNKELIIKELLSRLKMEAQLSLEPILRLIAALSRDLQKDFFSFLPRITEALVQLLKDGADREPEIIEKIFESWSCILMYLGKLLVEKIVFVLEATYDLRYYRVDHVQDPNGKDILAYHPKEHIQELMAAGTSFLLRHASDDYFVEADAVVKVLSIAFQRLSEELQPKHLNMMWNYLYQKIDECISKEQILSLSQLLSLLTLIIQINCGEKTFDYQPVLDCVRSIVQKFVVPWSEGNSQNHFPEIIDKVLQLMLCIIDGLKSLKLSEVSGSREDHLSCCALQWSPVFKLRSSSFLTFLHELVMRGPQILSRFSGNILSAMDGFIKISPEEVIFLLLSFCEKQQEDSLRSIFIDRSSERLSMIPEFLRQEINSWICLINGIVDGNAPSTTIEKGKVALLWGVICCYPCVVDIRETPSLIKDLIDAFDKLLEIKAENIAGISHHIWQSLLGAALSSNYNYGERSGREETRNVLVFAKKYYSSAQILSAVADYLDHTHGPVMEGEISGKVFHPEFQAEKTMDAFGIFADNLCNPHKGIRVATLRILSHYEPIEYGAYSGDQPPEKKMRRDENCLVDPGNNVLQRLLRIETTALSISTSREISNMIPKILSGGRISECYLPIVLSGIIGIFHNRFSPLWDPASECLSVLIGKHSTHVWHKFVQYIEQCQSLFKDSRGKLRVNDHLSSQSHDLIECFNSFIAPACDSTPSSAVLSSLIQCLQKVPSVAESHSRQIIPLFLGFLGYDNGDLTSCSIGSFNSDACKGKEWKNVLKEWLNFFKHIKNPRAVYQSRFVKDVLQIRLMDTSDAETQMKVLDCLVVWKDDFLLPYEQHLRNLINLKNMREELTTWNLSRESCLIEEGHRSNLVPLVIVLLMPKVRKLKLLSSRKNASVHHRKAILRFIAQLDISETSLFFALLIKPLHIIPKGADRDINLFWDFSMSSFHEFRPSDILKHFTMETISALSWKKKYGFLHVIQDALGVFDESHVRPFLDLLMGYVVRVLGSCSSSVNDLKTAIQQLLTEEGKAARQLLNIKRKSLKQLEDMSSMCLKIVSLVLNKYDDHHYSCEFWDLFFMSTKALSDSFTKECSSRKKSALFLCFLAMSRSEHLVLHLCREKNLVPDIICILNVPTASESLISGVLQFIENLLTLDDEMDEEESAVHRVLLPNLDKLIDSLHHLFQSDDATKRKLANYPQDSLIRIFKLLPKFIKDQVTASTFLSILLSRLAATVKDSDVCAEYLRVVRDIIPLSGSAVSSKILSTITPLLVSAGLDMRLSICDLLDALGSTDPSVLPMAKLLRDFNATSDTEIGGLDCDIGNAYEKIDINFFCTIQKDHVLVLLSHCVNDMSSEELILRHSAYRSLLSFVEFSALFLGGEVENQNMATNGGGWTRASILQAINKFLLRHVGAAMKAGISVRKEWIELLRDMVLKLPAICRLSSFKALWSEDAEQDFFNNIIHLQKHRRAKALSRFKNVLSKTDMSQEILNKVFVPLFFNMLIGVQDKKEEHTKNACMEALALISARMDWKSYYSLLLRCFREMNINLDKQKPLMQLICSMLDQFHFLQICPGGAVKDSSDKILTADSIACSSTAVPQKDGSSFSDGLGTIDSSLVDAEIRSCLHKCIWPKIQMLLDSDSDKVNVNISVAALKVLKLLPGDMMDSQLPSIIHRIANRLKSHSEGIRDESRLALAACLKELGLEYLKFVIKVLQATLKRGFEVHVLGYSLNFILSKFHANLESGILDHCLDDLLLIVENDILGDVAEEKEVEKIASKMKETKKRKSFETLQMIAQGITFRSHVVKLLSPVTAHLHEHLTPKMKTKLENMLHHIATGIECNPSVDLAELFIFTHGLIEDGIKEENGLREHPSDDMKAKYHLNDGTRKTASPGAASGNKSVCSHLLMAFALGLFHNRLKNLKSNKSEQIEERVLSMLDPFVKLLGNCLSSQYEDILAASLRCLIRLVGQPLPSLASQADRIKVTLLHTAQSSLTANSNLMQSCLGLLNKLLRNKNTTLSPEHLRLLIHLPLFLDLERNPSPIALELLEAIVKRNPSAREVYEVTVRVRELMVKSQEVVIRNKCSNILIQFLFGSLYSQRYLEEYLDFTIKNLSYEISTGRVAVLDMIRAIVAKAPKEFLDKHGQSLFIHLVQCLVNDNDNEVRLVIANSIKDLIRNISPKVRESILGFSLIWYKSAKKDLLSVGAQAIGLLSEVMGKSFKGYIVDVFQVCRDILQLAVPYSGEAVPFWKEAYYSLVMLEKILHQFVALSKRDVEDMVSGAAFQDMWAAVWQAVWELLLHPHAWVRNRTCHLIAFYSSRANGGGNEAFQNLFHMKPSNLFLVAASLCCQLKTQVIDADMSDLITGNLVFAICGVARAERIDRCMIWSGLEQHKHGRLHKAFELLDSRERLPWERHHDSGDQSINLRDFLISCLLKEMGKVALQTDAIQMKIVFTCFKEMSRSDKLPAQISQNEYQSYASDMLLPLYKVQEGFAGKVITDDLKQLAEEAFNTIQKTLGDNFIPVYSKMRNKVLEKRKKRKEEEKLMPVINPERNAKRKLRIAAKHRAHKKRKIMTMKMGRWMR
ncbi:hypothetical protein Tsubulata_002554 [Turnera subulata]|uniref:Uncharacterized protein n=1 Tax=Turnera subulata TaxID=218843 RepID=A0A9Q0GCA9_9ROSI|nr:hypothetical protein Tsubulata_002554 [Turnera subulata]